MSTTNTPLETGATGFWLTDRELRARLHQATEDLMATCYWAVQDDVTVIEALRDLAAQSCKDQGLDPAYVPLVQAHAAMAVGQWAIGDDTYIAPLDRVLLVGLDAFLGYPEAVQAALLERYTADETEFEITQLD